MPRASQCGFTYLGIIFLVAIMSLGLAMTTQVLQTVQQQDKEEELLYVGDQYRRALLGYYRTNRTYPLQLEDLLKDPRAPGVKRYLRRLYRDPVSGTDWVLVPAPGNGIAGIHSVSDAEPLKKDEFKLADQAFVGLAKYSEWVFFPQLTAASTRAIAPTTKVPAGAQPGLVRPDGTPISPTTATPRRR